MFPRNKVDLIYRLLCLLAFIFVIVFINSLVTLFIIALVFLVFSITEKRFENYFLYILTLVLFLICMSINNYFLLRVVLIIDYVHYYLNVSVLDDDIFDNELERNQKYIRFKEEKKETKDNNLLCTIFVTVHIIVLLLAIVVK